MSEAFRPQPLPTERAILWNPVTAGARPPAERPYQIFFDQIAVAALQEHLRTVGDQGVLGFLAGDLFECPDTHTRYIVIDKVLRLTQPITGDETAIVIERLWDRVEQQLERASGHLLGWYHSHAEPGIALSTEDVATHQQFFEDPWQVALLLGTDADAGGPAGGFFRPDTGDDWETTCVAFYELLQPESIRPDGKKRSLINWKNYKAYTPKARPSRPAPQPPVSSAPSEPPAPPAEVFPEEFEIEHHAAAVPPPPEPAPPAPPAPPPRPVARPTRQAEKPSIPLLYEPEETAPPAPPPRVSRPVREELPESLFGMAPVSEPPPPPLPPLPPPTRRAAKRALRRRGSGRWWRLVRRLAVVVVLGGGGAAAWRLGLVKPAIERLEETIRERLKATRAPPPSPRSPGVVAPPVRRGNPFARLDRLSDSLERAIRNYHDRAALFASGRLDCPGLARSLVSVERLWVDYSSERRARRAAFDAQRRQRDQQLYAGVDSVESRFERSRCARP